MRTLFTIDTHDYDPNGKAFIRPSVRGIVIQGGKVLMVHSLKYDYYKFPGGGIEAGETLEEALCREVAEESGFSVRTDSIRKYGLVHRVQKGEQEDIFIQDNFYYLCEVREAVGQHLDAYEAEERLPPNSSPPPTPSKPTASTTTAPSKASCWNGRQRCWNSCWKRAILHNPIQPPGHPGGLFIYSFASRSLTFPSHSCPGYS